jgi:hypothetical protein
MSKRRLPTLKQVAGERPRCQYCGKELKPVTETVEVTGHINVPPAVESLFQMPQPRPSYPPTRIAVDRGYRPERVFRMTSSSTTRRRLTPSCTSGPARIKDTATRMRRSFFATTTVADCSASLPGERAIG